MKLRIAIPDEEYAEIQKKADSFGLTISAYIRSLIKNPSNKEPQTQHTEVLRAIKALVPTLADTFGRTQKVSQELTNRLSQRLLEQYDKESGTISKYQN